MVQEKPRLPDELDALVKQLVARDKSESQGLLCMCISNEHGRRQMISFHTTSFATSRNTFLESWTTISSLHKQKVNGINRHLLTSKSKVTSIRKSLNANINLDTLDGRVLV